MTEWTKEEDEALKLALEALSEAHYVVEHRQDVKKREQAITAIKAALEAKDEPVAYMGTDIEGNPNKFRLNSFGGCIPLYIKKTGGVS